MNGPTESWAPGTTIWHLAGRHLLASGYPSISTLVDAIRAANPTIIDWQNVAVGTVVTIPYLQ